MQLVLPLQIDVHTTSASNEASNSTSRTGVMIAIAQARGSQYPSRKRGVSTPVRPTELLGDADRRQPDPHPCHGAISKSEDMSHHCEE